MASRCHSYLFQRKRLCKVLLESHHQIKQKFRQSRILDTLLIKRHHQVEYCQMYVDLFAVKLDWIWHRGSIIEKSEFSEGMPSRLHEFCVSTWQVFRVAGRHGSGIALSSLGYPSCEACDCCALLPVSGLASFPHQCIRHNFLHVRAVSVGCCFSLFVLCKCIYTQGNISKPFGGTQSLLVVQQVEMIGAALYRVSPLLLHTFAPCYTYECKLSDAVNHCYQRETIYVKTAHFILAGIASIRSWLQSRIWIRWFPARNHLACSSRSWCAAVVSTREREREARSIRHLAVCYRLTLLLL